MKNPLIKYVAIEMGQSKDVNAAAGRITLSSNGVIISGTITSKEAFYKAEQSKLLELWRQDVAKALKDMEEDQGLDRAQDEYLDEPYLYLKDAAYFHGAQRLPSQGDAYIAVALDSIDSFSMGSLLPV